MKICSRHFFFVILQPKVKKSLYIIIAALVLIGCANRGIGPQGGPKDSLPPAVVKSSPENGALEFHGKQIEVTFNEYLQLDNVSQNLIMSPPQQHPPEVKVRGKRLLVQFTDSLKDSTTYTLDFGKAICDFTERNPYRNYAFAFSTGSVIDTLEVRGKVYDAETLNPLTNIFVGIHSNMADSAFTTMPFARIARTDSAGAFRIGNMRAGVYRLYGVDDVSRDYRLTPGEALAFADSLVTPEVRPHYHTDSLGNDSLVGYEYGPADLQLWLFRPEQQRLYMQRTVREQQHMIRVTFSSSPDSVPSFRAISPWEWDTTLMTDTAWIDPTPYMHTQYSVHNDTITLWLTDSIAIGQDSIFLEARYRRTDSLYNLEWCTDTLRAIWRAPRMSAKAIKAKKHRDSTRKLELKSNAKRGFEIYDTLQITCTTPIMDVAIDSLHLMERKDTVYKPVAFRLLEHDTLPMKLVLAASLGAGKEYELRIDSGAMHDVYGVPNKKEKYSLQVKTPEDYSTLRVKLTPFVPKARIQVLNTKDQPVRELPAVPEGALFRYLKPDGYYMRLYIDANGDGKWTTGSWDEHRQPEAIYYFPDKIQTKSNWDFEEEWDYQAVERTSAKPEELIKASAAKKKK